MKVNPIPFLISAFVGLAYGWVAALWTLVAFIVLHFVLELTD